MNEVTNVLSEADSLQEGGE